MHRQSDEFNVLCLAVTKNWLPFGQAKSVCHRKPVKVPQIVLSSGGSFLRSKSERAPRKNHKPDRTSPCKMADIQYAQHASKCVCSPKHFSQRQSEQTAALNCFTALVAEHKS